MANQSVISIPATLDQEAIRRVLTRVVEALDVLAGDRGEATPLYATSTELAAVKTGLSKDIDQLKTAAINLNTRVKALES